MGTKSNAFHAAERDHPDEPVFPRSSSLAGREGVMAGCSVCRTDHLHRVDGRLSVPAQGRQGGGIR